MSRFSSRNLVLPLLAACLSLTLAATAQAQGTSATLQINFGTAPRWGGISGTHVREIRGGGHPDYDMFRFGNLYYVFNNDRWYTSRSGRGQFVVIDDRAVPREFSRIPRDHWKHYPSAWSNGNGNGNRENENNGRGNGKREKQDKGRRDR